MDSVCQYSPDVDFRWINWCDVRLQTLQRCAKYTALLGKRDIIVAYSSVTSEESSRRRQTTNRVRMIEVYEKGERARCWLRKREYVFHVILFSQRNDFVLKEARSLLLEKKEFYLKTTYQRKSKLLKEAARQPHSQLKLHWPRMWESWFMFRSSPNFKGYAKSIQRVLFVDYW